jgi:hypothetical protein
MSFSAGELLTPGLIPELGIGTLCLPYPCQRFQTRTAKTEQDPSWITR